MISLEKILEASLYLILILVVLTAIGFFARSLMQRRGFAFSMPAQQRLKIVERLYLDQRRQVIRLQDERSSYLVLLGATHEVLLNVENNSKEI